MAWVGWEFGKIEAQIGLKLAILNSVSSQGIEPVTLQVDHIRLTTVLNQFCRFGSDCGST